MALHIQTCLFIGCVAHICTSMHSRRSNFKIKKHNISLIDYYNLVFCVSYVIVCTTHITYNE